MKLSPPAERPVAPLLAWSTVAMAGAIAPAVALLLQSGADAPALAGVSAIAVGLMGAGIIGGAADGRVWFGLLLALMTGIGLLLLAQGLGAPPVRDPVWIGLAIFAASISFAARGALFARSGADKGWWIAVFVVAGEAALLATAAARPGALPEWLLSLLPAQWASMAIAGAVSDTGTSAAGAALVALAGTAAATLLVARLWPRRWPYLVMFTTWLALSALIHQQM